MNGFNESFKNAINDSDLFLEQKMACAKPMFTGK